MKVLALTMGEPAGIGGEIALGAWRALRASGDAAAAAFVLLDDADRFAGAPVRRVASPEEAGAVFASALPVLHRPLPRRPLPGRPDPANAPAVVAAIEEAVALAKAGRGSGGGAKPIPESAPYAARLAPPRHTEV